MNRLLLSTALAATCFTSAALAQSALPEGFDVNGHVALVYSGLFDSDDGETYAVGDVDVSWTSGTFGIDVSGLAFATEDNSISAFFGAVTYTFGDGQKISFGAPRAAFDKYAKFRHPDYYEYFGAGGYRGSTSILTFYDLQLDDIPFTILGLRYDGQLGGVDVAVSYHGSPDGAGFLISSSAQSKLGTGTISGGFDHLDVDDVQMSTVKLRYDTKVGLFDLGAGAINTHIGTSMSSINSTILELAADYSFTDHISAGGMWMDTRQSSGGTSISRAIYGLRGKYDFNNGASANASLLQYEGYTDVRYAVDLRYDF